MQQLEGNYAAFYTGQSTEQNHQLRDIINIIYFNVRTKAGAFDYVFTMIYKFVNFDITPSHILP